MMRMVMRRGLTREKMNDALSRMQPGGGDLETTRTDKGPERHGKGNGHKAAMGK